MNNKIHEDYDSVVTLRHTPEETKQIIFDMLMGKFYNKYESYSGESICQNDNTLIEAAYVLADIADNIFKIYYKEEDDEN